MDGVRSRLALIKIGQKEILNLLSISILLLMLVFKQPLLKASRDILYDSAFICRITHLLTPFLTISPRTTVHGSLQSNTQSRVLTFNVHESGS